MNNHRSKIITFTLFIIISLNSFGQSLGDYGSVASSNWSLNTTWKIWDGSGFNAIAATAPTSSDNVYIQGGNTVTIDVDVTCTNLTIGFSGTAGVLEFETSSQHNLTISGSLIINSGASAGILQISALDQPVHSISISGNLTNSGTINLWRTINQKANISINGNIISGNGDFTFNNLTMGGGTVSCSSTSIINLFGNFTDNSTTSFTATNGTFNFISATTQNINGTSTGTTTLNNFTVGNSDATNLILNRDINVSSSLTLNTTGETISLNGYNLTVNGNYIRTSGTIRGNTNSNLSFNGPSAAQALVLSTDFNLKNLTFSCVSGIGGSYILGSAITIINNFSLSGNSFETVTLDVGTNNFIVNGTSGISGYGIFNDTDLTGINRFIGAVTIGANGQWATANNPAFEFRGGLTFNGSSFVSGTGNYSFTSNAQSISGSASLAINNIIIAGITLTNTNTGGITVDVFSGTGNLTNGLNGRLNLNALNTITITGTVDFITNNNIVNYLPNLAQNIYTTTYRNLQISGGGTKSLVNSIMVNGILTLNTGALSIGNYTLTLNSTISYGTGTFTGGGTSNLIINDIGSAAAANISTISLNNFTLNRANGVTLSGAVTIGGTTTLTLGTLSIGANTLTLNGNLNYGTGTIVGSTSSNLVVGGAAVPSNLTLPAITLNNFTINRANGVTLTGNLITGGAGAGIITLTNGIINTNGNTVTSDNATTASINSGSPTSYVQGLFRRKFIPAMTAGTYYFPVGKSSYNSLSIITTIATTGSGSTYISAEDFDVDEGGTAGFGITNVNVVARYWQLQSSSGTVVIDNSSTVQIYQTGLTNGTHCVAQSNSKTGTYTDKGGTVAGNVISTSYNAAIGYVIDYSFVSSSSSTYLIIGTKISLSGTILVGASQNIKKLREISWLLNRYPLLSDVIFELQDDYDGSDEFSVSPYINTPIAFNQFPATVPVYSAIISLAPGVTTPKITSGDPGSGNSLIILNGVDNITFDGQVSSNKWWTFRNTRTLATVGPTFQFINDAQSNKLTYLSIEGQNITAPANGAAAGTVNFYSSAGTNGNDNNTISYCDIRENTASSVSPVVAIFADATAVAYTNDGTTISNCNIYNFYNAGLASTGIWTNRNCDSWTISGNSFYQTSARNMTAAIANRAIYSRVGSNIITSNFIGGSAPLCGGTAWTTTGSFNTQLFGIDVITTGFNLDIQNNTITNFDISTAYATASAPGAWAGINISGTGNANIGNTTKNIIGSSTLTDVIFVKPGNGAIVCGISSSGTGTIQIINNEIGGITNASTTVANGGTVGAITTSGANGNYTITGNLIGSTTIANSIKAGVPAFTTAACTVFGINNSASGTLVLNGNTIQNLRSNSIGGATTAYGITNIGTSASITIGTNLSPNIISTLTASSTGAGASSCYGIASSAGIGSTNINYNTINTLQSNSTTATTNTFAINSTGVSVISINISNNTLTGLTANNTAAGTSTCYGINNAAGTAGITLDGNSLTSNISNSTTGSSIMYAIQNSGTGTVSIQNNSIDNFTGSGTGNGGTTRGIISSAGTNTIQNNIITNLTSLSTQVGTGSTAQMVGLLLTANNDNQKINRNTIYTLKNTTGAATAIYLTGIYSSCTGLNQEIGRNLIHSFQTASTGARQVGIQVDGTLSSASGVIHNNIIRLGMYGVGATATDLATIYGICGIYNTSNADNSGYYYNSIYIGGTGATTDASYCLYKSLPTNDNIRNNIFVNARSGSVGLGMGNFAFDLESPANVICDYNIYKASGTNGKLASLLNITKNTLRDIQVFVPGQNLHCGVGDPNYVDATGGILAISLKVQGSTPAYGTGIAISTINTDYEGDARATIGAVNIGADEGIYTMDASVDIFSPVFSYTPIPNQLLTAGTISVFVTITDQGMGLDASTYKPRMYCRKSSTLPDIGHQNWAIARFSEPFSVVGNIYEFQIDPANIAPINSNDIIEYFFVAQDLANTPNISYSKFDAATPLFTNTQTASSFPALAPVDNYAYEGNLPATIYINNAGFSGGDNTNTLLSLTGSGGLFQMMNCLSINKNITVIIETSHTEPGTFGLKQWIENPVGSNFTLKIQPHDATAHTLTCSNPKDFIRFEGCDRVTVDGNFSGSGRYLVFVNTSTNYAVLQFANDATNNTFQNCEFQGGTTTTPKGVIWFDLGATTGNDYNTITGCKIVNYSIYNPDNSIFSLGSPGTASNSNNTITNNEIANFTINGINISSDGNGDGWNISGNSVYYNPLPLSNAPIAGGIHTGISVQSGNRQTISNNFVGGKAVNCGGTAWTHAYNIATRAFDINVGAGAASTITNNTIQNFNLTSNGGSTFFTGIYIAGGNTATINGNIIGHVATANSIINAGAGTTAINVVSLQSGLNITNNLISNIRATANSTFRGLTMNVGNASLTSIQGNTIQNIALTGGNTSTLFYGIELNGANNGKVDIGSLTGNTITGITTNGIAVTNPIRVVSTSTGHIINNNSITNITASANAAFQGITLSVGTAAATSVQNNTIQSITVAGTGTSSFVGIYGVLGLYNIGNISANTIGHASTTNSIQFAGTGTSYGINAVSLVANNIISNNIIANLTNSSSACTFYGIYGSFANTTLSSIQNNTVRNITLSNAGASNLYGIWINVGRVDIGATAGNQIGNPTNTNSISFNGTGNCRGIYLSVDPATISTIQNNNIQGFNLSNIGGTERFDGIYVNAGLVNIGNVGGNTIGHATTVNSITNNGSGGTNGIYITSATPVNNQVISNNLISNITATSNFPFQGIYLNVGTTGATSIQNNTIQSITVSGTGASSFTGIYANAGLFNIGNITANTIGHTSTANSVQFSGTGTSCGIYATSLVANNVISNNIIANFTNNSSACTFYGIYGNFPITTSSSLQNNTIKNITLSNSGPSNFSGIWINAGRVDVGATTGNQIGDPLNINSISFNGTGYCRGIYLAVDPATISTIQNNKIQGFNLSNISSTARFDGIYVNAGLVNIGNVGGNSIGHATTVNSITNNGIGGTNGIYVTSSTPVNSQVVSNNLVSNIIATADAPFQGIYLNVGTVGATSVQNNSIQSIIVSGTGASSFAGIYGAAGLYNIGNTMANTIGHNSTANSIQLSGTGTSYGIYAASTVANNNISNNLIANFTNSNSACTLFGIYGSFSNTILSSLQNNTIRNITLSNAGPSNFSGIWINSGRVDIGATSGNQIGDPNDVNNISFGGTGNCRGIYVDGDVTTISTIQKNNIQGFNLSNITGNERFDGIYINSGLVNIGNSAANTIGHATTINSITNIGTGGTYGIYLSTGALDNQVVSNNLISNITANGNAPFQGIYLNVGTAIASTVQNNTIQSIHSAGNGANGFSGIYGNAGLLNLGNVTGNKISNIVSSGTGNLQGMSIIDVSSGSLIKNNIISNLIGNDNISGIYVNSGNFFTISDNTVNNCNIPNTNNPNFVGIELSAVNASNSTLLQNNKIENIIIDGSTATFKGILITAGKVDLIGNFVGHATNANSISCAGTETHGMENNSSDVVSIQNNSIANLTSTNSSTSGVLSGVLHSGTGIGTILGNTIHDLNSTSGNVDLSTGIISGQGIAVVGNSASTISSNTIYQISGNGTAASNIAGISENAPNIEITKNIIYDIRNNSSNANATANGIVLKAIASANGVNNNMIAIGTDGENPVYSGIYLPVSDAVTKNIYYNSINIRGNSTGANNSYGFILKNPASSVNIKNNIFYNSRTGTGNHFAIGNAPIGALWDCNYNNIFSSNSSTIGYWGSTPYSLTNWQTTSSNDANSVSEAVSFANASIGNLHLNIASSCGANGGATPILIITDFDGMLRNTTRPDIGADEFTPTGGNSKDFWTGAVSTNWETAGNWGCELVPATTTDLTIQNVTNDPIINSNVVIKALTINANSFLSINPGNSLTLTGAFINNGTLTIETPTAEGGATGSFIDNGTISGTGQFIAKRFINANQWHEVSSPINNASSAIFTRSHPYGNYNANLYFYNETLDLDGNPGTNPTGAGAFDSQKLSTGWAFAQNGVGGADVTLINNKGYMFYTNVNQVITFTGIPNTGNFDATNLTYTNNDPRTGVSPNLYDGWHLLGNPYPSSINWNLIKDDQTVNIEDGVYIWDATGYSGYKDGLQVMLGNLTNIIPPMQAFFVHANANLASVQIRNEHRTHGAPEYLKSSVYKPNYLKIKTSANGWNDYFITHFEADATTEYDGAYDMVRMFSTDPTIPQLYSQSLILKDPLVLNCLPTELLNNFADTLGLAIGNAGKCSFTVDEIHDFANINVVLEDRNLNTFTNLKNIPEYHFEFEGGNIKNRFVIHYEKNTAPNLNLPMQDAHILVNENFNYQIPGNTFVDNNIGDSLSITAKMKNGDNLPQWLSFANNTFTGSTNIIGEYQIQVIATDNQGASTNTDFSIFVTELTNIIPVSENEISVYPNPSDGKFKIDLKKNGISTNWNIDVKDISGKIVYHDILTNTQEHFDLSTLPAGNYFIELQSGENTIIKKMIIK